MIFGTYVTNGYVNTVLKPFWYICSMCRFAGESVTKKPFLESPKIPLFTHKFVIPEKLYRVST